MDDAALAYPLCFWLSLLEASADPATHLRSRRRQGAQSSGLEVSLSSIA